eukprot:1358322-Amorphochlora_amoeboformis.AAC.2
MSHLGSDHSRIQPESWVTEMRRLGHAFWRGARARGRAFLSVESGDLKRLLMENEVVVLSRSDDAFGKRVRSFLDTKSIPYRSLEVDIMGNILK